VSGVCGVSFGRPLPAALPGGQWAQPPEAALSRRGQAWEQLPSARHSHVALKDSQWSFLIKEGIHTGGGNNRYGRDGIPEIPRKGVAVKSDLRFDDSDFFRLDLCFVHMALITGKDDPASMPIASAYIWMNFFVEAGAGGAETRRSR